MSQTATQRAENEVKRVAARANALVGLCAIHIETGQRIVFDSESRFPMASTYKLPIAMQLLKLVEQGRASLEQLIDVTESDLSPGDGPITVLLGNPGVRLSIRNLLDLMLRVSDNTASDIILRLAGGPSAVTDFMRGSGIGDLNVDRFAKQVLMDFYGIADKESEERWSVGKFATMLRATTPESRAAARETFLNDSRDTCTPVAMASLLVGLQRGEVVSEAHSELVLSIMRGCQTGPARMKGLLPPGTLVAHKTGSLEGRTVCDVGLVELPDHLGNVAIAAFVKGKEPSLEGYERAIAHMSRTIYDCFLFSAGQE
jgi:beta-lactamase class A